jgi:hypothetical protein
MKEIALTGKIGSGKFVIVDDDDYEELNKYKWSMMRSRKTDYARRLKNVLMHRLISGASDGFVVDHINGNGLDNRKENLRVCTVSQNSKNNKCPLPRNKLGIRNICKRVQSGKYVDYIVHWTEKGINRKKYFADFENALAFRQTVINDNYLLSE